MLNKTLMLAVTATLLLPLAERVEAQTTRTVPSAETNEASQPVKSARKPGKPSGKMPDDVPGLQKVAVEAYREGEYLRFLQATMLLRKLRPYEPQYMIGMVAGAARIGRQNTAYNYMHVMQQQGLAYDFNSTEDTESIRGTEVYEYLNDLLVRADAPAGEGQVAFDLGEAQSYPETMVWDESRGRFLIGDLQTGSVTAISPDGQSKEKILQANDQNGLRAIQGLAVDLKNNRLWVTSTGVPGFKDLKPEDLGKGALFEFNLESLELLNRFEVPADGLPHLLASIAVSPGGDVFAMDRAIPMIYRKAAEGTELEPFVGNPQMSGFRDMALNETGDTLYVADVGLGILVIELEGGNSGMLAAPETLNLGGISGLFYRENSLFIIQNGISPQRVVRIDLDPQGKSVLESSPLAVALPPFNYPAFGAIEGDSLYYFASSNVPGANDGAVEVTIMKTPLELEDAIVSAESAKFNDEIATKKGGQDGS